MILQAAVKYCSYKLLFTHNKVFFIHLSQPVLHGFLEDRLQVLNVISTKRELMKMAELKAKH